MKNAYFKFVIGILPLVVFFGCTTSTLSTSRTPSTEIENLHYFKPVSFISYIEKGNRGDLNEELSDQSSKLITYVLKDKAALYHISDSIKYPFSDDEYNAENAIVNLVDQIEFQGNTKGVTIPPVLNSIMEDNNTRFSLVVLANGFARRKGNYTGQVFKSIGIGILTMGIYNPVPIKSRSNLYVIILDSYNNEIAFYRKSFLDDASPIEPKVINKQMDKIFRRYFY
ncbi:hypothetical protein C9994_03270 [Marivirga lumbricoides]|uniref:Uncharacterized protein n=1 Tax=Marivirga lumbricoides TaxID=1046115 RepID=A0A2T4DU84_9BACT|nr:hypothetical protein C9994_03270 [Marivirga lumbricoides]